MGKVAKKKKTSGLPKIPGKKKMIQEGKASLLPYSEGAGWLGGRVACLD